MGRDEWRDFFTRVKQDAEHPYTGAFRPGEYERRRQKLSGGQLAACEAAYTRAAYNWWLYHSKYTEGA